MRVVLVTKSDDNDSVLRVAGAVARRGGRAFRFDTDRYPTQIRVTTAISGDEARATVHFGSESVDLADVAAIWHRRLAIGAGIPEEMDPQLRKAALDESERVLLGSLARRDVFVLDPRTDLRRASDKELQLCLARELGLDVPRTLISNDPAAVRAFADLCGGDVVTKMMTSFAVYADGLEQVVFTNRVSVADLADLDGLRYCPMTFQERLAKEVELRVTIVGRRIFAASIESQRMERAREDWRREGVALMKAWRPYALSADLEGKLFALMDALRLNYGALDLVVTPEGRTVFLEVNPVGEFFWLEESPGFAIADAIADVLLGLAPRR